MSVFCLSNSELKSLYLKLSDLVEKGELSLDISKKALRRFIARLGFCNRLAFEFTYLNGNDNIQFDIPDFDAANAEEMSLKELVEKLTLLEYNCITNSGKCFLDEKDRKRLLDIIDSLKWRYIRHLEWQLKKKN